MFYGALDEGTATAEIGTPAFGDRTIVGRWSSTRPMVVLDLTRLPSLPSFYDIERASERQGLQFMEQFSRDVSQPLDEESPAELAYRPTQALTGYMRTHIATLDGILYTSSRTGAACCVLFVDNADCIDVASEDADAVQLLLVSTLEGDVRRARNPV